MEIQVERNDIFKDTNETKDTVDSLNQAQVSLLTDDNSVINDSEQSDLHLNYSDDRIEEEKAPEIKNIAMSTGNLCLII